MSQIISFSADREFAADFDNLIERSGYKNRSRFIRDAALFFAEMQQRGDLMEMDPNEVVEGHFWHLVLKTTDGSPIRMSVVNDATSRAHQIDSEVTIGFDVAGAIALPSGALAAE